MNEGGVQQGRWGEFRLVFKSAKAAGVRILSRGGNVFGNLLSLKCLWGQKIEKPWNFQINRPAETIFLRNRKTGAVERYFRMLTPTSGDGGHTGEPSPHTCRRRSVGATGRSRANGGGREGRDGQVTGV